MNMSFIHVGWSITLLSCGTSESYATQKMLNVLIIPLLAEVFTRSQPLNHPVIKFFMSTNLIFNYQKLCFPLVFASCLDGSIYEFNIGSDKKPRRAFRGHVMDCNGSNHVKLRISPDEKFLIIGSTDGHPRIYPTSNKILKNNDEISINNPGSFIE